MQVYKTSWQKLKSGQWGIRVEGPTEPGRQEMVVSGSGKTSYVYVSRVMWTDGKVSLCQIHGKDFGQPTRAAARYQDNDCDEFDRL